LQNASESVRALTGVSGDDQGSFFQEMETQLSTALKMLGTCTAARMEMDSTSPAFLAPARECRKSVAGIGGTEIQIQRISTNATIRATHIGGGYRVPPIGRVRRSRGPIPWPKKCNARSQVCIPPASRA